MTERDLRERGIGFNLSEDGTLKFDFMTSLEKISIAKVSSILWMNQNTHQDIVNLFHRDIYSDGDELVYIWKQIEDNVVAKVSELCLPNSTKKMLQRTVVDLGNSILSLMQYHDIFILDTGKNSNYSAVDLISYMACTTRGKIDFTKTDKNVLANQGNSLSDDQKYKIAYAYCLEDDISILASKVLNQYYLDSIDMDTFPMVHFWTTHITGNHVNTSFNEYIIKGLIYLNTDGWIKHTVPIRYMWNKLSKQEKADNVISLLGNCDQDLRHSLLSNLDYEQQQDIFKACSSVILCGILNDWLWEENFLPIALYLLEIMEPQSYENIFEEIIDKMRENYYEKNYYLYHQYKCILKTLWKDSSRHLKDYIFGPITGGSVVFSLSWKRDLDIIDLIFKDINNAQQKKNIIFSIMGINRCSYFIERDEWNLLELLMEYTLSSEEDINELKKKIIIYYGVDIARTYLKGEAFDKIEKFVTWVFNSMEEMDHFRQSPACEAPLESIIKNNNVDFTKMEKHFKWCAKDDLELINKFKYEILESSFGKRFIKNLIKECQYELLDQVLSWCYLGNQQEIEQFKCNVYKNNLSSVMKVYILLIKKDNYIKMLDKFIGWSFTNEQQVQEFKAPVLCPERYEYSSCVFMYLLETHQFQLADEFIKWCGISSEAESIFKNALMVREDIVCSIIFRSTEQDIQLLIRWFNPSIETLHTLKAISKQAFRRCEITEILLNSFLKLLDEFIENQKLLRGSSEKPAFSTFLIHMVGTMRKKLSNLRNFCRNPLKSTAN